MSLTQELIALFPHGLDGIIFDCDGVLIDSSHVNVGYYNLLLGELGKAPMDKDAENYVRMSSVTQSLNYITSPEERERLPELIERLPYKKHALPLLSLEPELKEMLEEIASLGLCRAVHTNRGAGMHDVLEHFDLVEVFDPVMTCDIVKPKPDPEGIFHILEKWKSDRTRVLFIGDSMTDFNASAQADIPFAAYNNTQLDTQLHIASYHELGKALTAACLHWQNKE